MTEPIQARQVPCWPRVQRDDRDTDEGTCLSACGYTRLDGEIYRAAIIRHVSGWNVYLDRWTGTRDDGWNNDINWRTVRIDRWTMSYELAVRRYKDLLDRLESYLVEGVL